MGGGRVEFVVESAVGERAAESFVKEQEQERNVNAPGGQAVSVAATVALDQAMAFQLAQIGRSWLSPYCLGESRNVVRTASWICFAVQPPTVLPLCSSIFEKTDDPGVLNFDAGITN